MVGTIILAVLWVISGWAFNDFAKRSRKEIADLKRENLTLAKVSQAHHKRMDELWKQVDLLLLEREQREKRLTAEAEKPKIIAKPAAPKRVNWHQAREALENRDAPEEE
jgi:hypothetical protein